MKVRGRAIGAAAVAALLTSGGIALAAESAQTPTETATATQTAPVPAARVETIVLLDEVQVVSKRLYEMRQDIIKAEDKFLAAYNALNTDDDYDVHCMMDVPTGTKFKYRICKPVFFAKAQEAEARYFLTGEYAPPADLVSLERETDYRDRALAVINAHPELRKMIQERDELERRYNETRKKRFKGKLIVR